jgi:hypothetical protein
MERDCITAAEFTRWMQQESEFRSRLEHRLEVNAAAVQTGLGVIQAHLAEINGRTRKNSEAIAVLERELQAMESEERHIEAVVDEIKAKGCAQLVAHREVVETLGWPAKKKAVVAGTLLTGGALAWPALQEIAGAIHAGVEWFAKR